MYSCPEKMMLPFILTVSISLAVTCLCSILESVLLSLSATDMARMNNRHVRASNIWRRLKENIHQPIAVILIVNTFAHTIGASLSGAQFDRLFGHKWIWVYSIVYSLVMIQWTEILPKTLAVRYKLHFAEWLSSLMSVLMKVFAPAVLVVDFLNRPFSGGKKDDSGDTISDIEVLAHFASSEKMITDRQEMIVGKGLALSSIKVREIMVSKEEIKFLSSDMSLAEALIEAHIHHHTRFPLMLGKDSNAVIGYVNFKDIVSAMQLNPKNPSLKGICRPVITVDIDDTVSSLLNRLIKSYQHIAVVKDSLERVKGVVTLEDVIESIVGEINDEYDVLPDYIYQIAENRYVAGGGTPMSRISTELSRPLAAASISLNDWMVSRMARVPKAEDIVHDDGVSFNVRKVRRSQVYEAVVTVNQ